jgi:hypothetical protein
MSTVHEICFSFSSPSLSLTHIELREPKNLTSPAPAGCPRREEEERDLAPINSVATVNWLYEPELRRSMSNGAYLSSRRKKWKKK